MDDSAILSAQALIDRLEREYRKGTHGGGDVQPRQHCAYPEIVYRPDLWSRLEPLTEPGEPLHRAFHYKPNDYSQSEKNLAKDFLRHVGRMPLPVDLSCLQQLFLRYRAKHPTNVGGKDADLNKPLRSDYICMTAERAIAELNQKMIRAYQAELQLSGCIEDAESASQKYNWLRDPVPFDQVGVLRPFWLEKGTENDK